jgi:hypothetical protein
MKNSVFWDVAPCRSCVNRRFGGTYRLHLQGREIRERGTSLSRWLLNRVPRSRTVLPFGGSWLAFVGCSTALSVVLTV